LADSIGCTEDGVEYNEAYRGHRIKISVSQSERPDFRGDWLFSCSITKPDDKPFGPSRSGYGDSEKAAKQRALNNAKAEIDKHLGP
jgi:hypothetical protein